MIRMVHFSDLHVWRAQWDWSDPSPKRVLGLANLLLRRRSRFPAALARAVVERIAKEDANLCIFSGDLTTTALRAEFEAGRDLFVPLLRRWGARFYLIPGNHDRYTRGATSGEWFERAFPSGRFGDARRPVRTLEVNDRLAVVGFDCSVPRSWSSRGCFSAALAEGVDVELARQTGAGRQVVLVGHYPYARPGWVKASHEHGLDGSSRLVELIARHKPAFYLHGHKHIRWALRARETPETLCVDAGSAGMRARKERKRAGYLVIELEEDGRLHGITAHVAAMTGAGGGAEWTSFPIVEETRGVVLYR